MTPVRADALDQKAAQAAAIAAFLLIANQVASRAVRDALFLSAFEVRSLPLVMGAAAIAALVGAEILSRALARRSPARVVPAAAALSALLLPLGRRRPRRRPGPRLCSSTSTSRHSAGAHLGLLVARRRTLRPARRARVMRPYRHQCDRRQQDGRHARLAQRTAAALGGRPAADRRSACSQPGYWRRHARRRKRSRPPAP